MWTKFNNQRSSSMANNENYQVPYEEGEVFE
jgi:hypothetical protein